ncbi:MAG: hypothetical protein ACI4U3_00650 [Traorella sp.]
MRKGIFLTLFCLMLFEVPIDSKSNELKFVIVFDSSETQIIKEKQVIVDLLHDTLENVSEKSWKDMIFSSLDEMETEERDVYAYFSTVYFILGDGKGSRIEMNLLASSFCMVDVKPKSLLRKWFHF